MYSKTTKLLKVLTAAITTFWALPAMLVVHFCILLTVLILAGCHANTPISCQYGSLSSNLIPGIWAALGKKIRELIGIVCKIRINGLWGGTRRPVSPKGCNFFVMSGLAVLGLICLFLGSLHHSRWML